MRLVHAIHNRVSPCLAINVANKIGWAYSEKKPGHFDV